MADAWQMVPRTRRVQDHALRAVRAALLIAGLCAGIALAELLLGLASPQIRRIPRLWQYDAELGWEHVPHARVRMVTPEFDVEVVINGAGLRGGDAARHGLCRGQRR